MTISRFHVSTHRGDVIYLEAVRWPVNCFTRSRTTFNLILLLVWEHRKTDNAHILDINVLINWQLSKQSTRWPVSLDRIAGSGVDPSRSSIFWSYPLTSKLVFKWSQAQVQFFFLIHMKLLCLCAAQLKFWLQTDLGRENSASCYRQGRQLLLFFLTMVTRWSRSTSNFYALIGQNLTGEFMRKIYAASWILFTLTAEADRVLCQLVMFLTVFFHWMYKMKFSCYQESSVTHG